MAKKSKKRDRIAHRRVRLYRKRTERRGELAENYMWVQRAPLPGALKVGAGAYARNTPSQRQKRWGGLSKGPGGGVVSATTSTARLA